MQSVAQSWLVYRLTGSIAILGLLGFCSQIPVFLFASLGGALADRVRRHRIMIATQISAMTLAFALAALTLSDLVRPWHLFALASLLGVVNAFDIPARQSFVVEMVGKDDLLAAIALNSSMVHGARMVGPALAGVTVAALGEGWCFFLNAVSFIAVIACLLRMRDLPKPAERAPGSMMDGFRFAGRTPEIRSVLLLLGLVSLTGMPYTVLMPAYADRVLHGGPRTLGVLIAASGGGALLGALAITLRAKTEHLERWIAAAAALFGVSLVLFSASRNLFLSIAALVPVGAGAMTQMSTSNTLLQTRTPDAMRGRVMALFAMMFMGTAPFGALLSGFVASQRDAPFATLCGGICCVAGAVIFWMRRSSQWPFASRL